METQQTDSFLDVLQWKRVGYYGPRFRPRAQKRARSRLKAGVATLESFVTEEGKGGSNWKFVRANCGIGAVALRRRRRRSRCDVFSSG